MRRASYRHSHAGSRLLAPWRWLVMFVPLPGVTRVATTKSGDFCGNIPPLKLYGPDEKSICTSVTRELPRGSSLATIQYRLSLRWLPTTSRTPTPSAAHTTRSGQDVPSGQGTLLASHKQRGYVVPDNHSSTLHQTGTASQLTTAPAQNTQSSSSASTMPARPPSTSRSKPSSTPSTRTPSSRRSRPSARTSRP